MATDDQDTVDFGTASSAPAGTVLKDRYILIRQLNEGGFGSVHLAHDQEMHGRLVVVKIQINRRIDDPWFERKFSEEVRALSMIDHPGVVVAIDSGRTPDGKPFLVMQYVDGVTLRAVMSPDGMPLDRAAEILKQVGNALNAVHEKGIWHRDLKPENLMLQSLAGAGERVRIIDFGIATVADIKNKFQTTTRVAGSYYYMAPEQTNGQPSALTDIYAMGLIAYEMVTGRKPFIAENSVQLAELKRSGVRVKPSDLRPALSPSAERLILKSLEYEPTKRPQNARAFGDALHDALLDSGATAITGRPPAESGTRRRWFLGSAAAATVFLAGAYFAFRRPGEPPKPTRAKTEAPAKDASVESAIELAYWNSVKDSIEPALYREYLDKYPEGRFASLAKVKLDILGRKAPPKASAAVAKSEGGAREEEVETAFWNSIKDSSEPQLYRDYLDKYPHGRFASVARTKLKMLAQRAPLMVHPGRPNKLIPDVAELRNLSAYDPKTAAELSEWSALKDAKDSQPYLAYLSKYPTGMFASLAKLKIAGFEKVGAHPNLPEPGAPPLPPAIFEHHAPDGRPGPGPLRPAVRLENYSGPQQGELRWSGQIAKGRRVAIQGGKPNIGILVGDLPRVPVTLEVVGGEATIMEPPSARNNWDRVLIRNESDSPATAIVVRWTLAR